MIDDNTKRAVHRMLLGGSSPREIHEALDGAISIRQIQRMKKAIATATPQAVETDEGKNVRRLSKKEEYYTALLQAWEEYEDTEEGWVFHLTKEKLRLMKKGMWFWGIAYPESAPEDWIDQMEMTMLEVEISPLHDHDTWTHDSPEVRDPETGKIIHKRGARYHKGDEKKAHWHFIIKFPKTVRYEYANDLIRSITHGPYIQRLDSLVAPHDYLTHEGKPDKHHYDKEEIIRLNGFTVELDSSAKKILKNEITSTIHEHTEWTEFSDVTRYYQDSIEYVHLISTHAYYFDRLILDNWRRSEKDKDKMQYERAVAALKDCHTEEQWKEALHRMYHKEAEQLYKEEKHGGKER